MWNAFSRARNPGSADARLPEPADLEDRIARLRLIRTSGIGPVTYAHLLARFPTAQQALKAVPELARRGGGKPPVLAPRAAVEQEVERVASLGARYIFQGDAGYPALLAQVENAPPVLIVRGVRALLRRPAVAMVGARNASAAGIRLARQIATELAAEGIAVVSGLARGIDTAAHEGAFAGEQGGGTVAVVAGGIDIFYPPENAALQERIATGGLLLAEQPPGQEPRARHFPYRNRIIAGLAQATVVVEAAPRSGSLITARYAADYGRDVLAVPGSPLDPRAQGCNQLIRDGATLVQGAADILDSLRPLADGAAGDDRIASPARAYAAPAPGADASDAERARVGTLLSPAPTPVDEIVRLSGIAPAIVQTILLELELAGRLERHAGGRVSLA